MKWKERNWNNIKVSGENSMFCAADALRWYHPAGNTCALSLPALDRQEVVTDDRGSSYPEGIHFTRCSLDFWWKDGSEEIIQYSGDPQNSYLCTTCQSLSVVLKEAISQCECDSRWSPCCQKTQPTLSTFELWDASWCTSFGNRYGAMFDCIDFAEANKNWPYVFFMSFTGSHDALFSFNPVWCWCICPEEFIDCSPPKTTLARPLMRPPTSCLYYEGCIPIERQERGDRLSLRQRWSPPWPEPSNAPLTESQIMGLINI